ncbi:MAG: uncharacterized protein QOD86_616 [Miltoncostaeaceae bacterium]|jgi:ketosteroid isomerase-like protein|nr:uncharacterized protein [Miltoncostaeaceae bacterium]
MDGDPRIDLVRRFSAAGPADEDSARADYSVPEFVWHVPGGNAVSGRYDGYDEVFREIGARMGGLEDWDLEVRAVMANEDLVMAVVEVAAERVGRRVSCLGGHLFRLAPDGRIAEAWGFVEDQAGLDEVLHL